MNNRTRLLLVLAAALILLMIAGCASNDRVDRLERDIRALQGQVSQQMLERQSTEASVTQQLADIDERMNASDQRLAELETGTAGFSESDDDIRSRMSEIEGRLDERAINRIFMMPLTYVVVAAVLIVVLLISILIGFWIHHRKYHRA